MKTISTLLQGIALGAGMLLTVGLVLGAFQYMEYLALIIGMAILAVLGFVLGRWVWPRRNHAWKITAAAFAFFMLFQFSLVLFTSGSRGLAGMLDGVLMAIWLYVPWFWLPLAIGILAGGFRRKTRHTDPSEHPTLVS